MKIEQIRKKLSDKDAAIIRSDANRRYMTGFKSSAGIIFISKRSALFLIDFRYYEKAKKDVKDFDVILLADTFAQLGEIISSEHIENIFVETDDMSVSDFKNYSDSLDAVLSDSSVLTDILNDMRMIKSREELKSIETAQNFAEKTFDYILGRIEAGRTEREIMLDMEFFMRRLGSEGVAFEFIVVSGKNSSLPHGRPTGKIIEAGDFVTMDFGARFNGYCSDMTRTVAVGHVSDKQKDVYKTVLDAQLKSLDIIKPGVICKNVDEIARSHIYSSGYEGCFGHGLGHSLGIEVHESPSFNTRCKTLLKPGMVMTVEPGIYIPDEFGVRIEDMVYIIEDGCINLTNSPKNLIIL